MVPSYWGVGIRLAAFLAGVRENQFSTTQSISSWYGVFQHPASGSRPLKEITQMSSLAIPSENQVEPPSVESCEDSTISRPRYLVLQSLVGVMLAYQLLSGVELIASRPLSIVIVGGLAALVLFLWYVPTSILQAAWFSGALIGIDTILVTATIYLSGNARSDLYLS